MAAVEVGRALTLYVIILFILKVLCDDLIEKQLNVKIHAYRPKGFKLSFEDAPKLKSGIWVITYVNKQKHYVESKQSSGIPHILFGEVPSFRLTLYMQPYISRNRKFLNQTLSRNYTVAALGPSGYLLQDTDGSWMLEDRNVQLKFDDFIGFHFLLGDGLIYSANTTVEEIEDPPLRTEECRPSVTKVRGGKACSGHTIFEDHFNSLREDVWQTEQYIPVNHPENPFVSYQHLTSEDTTVSVSNGSLRITPRLQQNQPGFSNESIEAGTLNLFSSCTSATEACVKEASGADILPPVVSGRIISKGFAFTYGTVHVRAKLPKGDWLYPEILLEPFLKKYGRLNYVSGVLKIATARGNKELIDGSTEYGNKVLYGGPVMDFQCREMLLKTKHLTAGRHWGDEYHVYSVRWAPDRITFSVDGEEWGRVDPSASGLAGRIPKHCDQLPRTLLAFGSKLAPFDDHFYITLGVAAGGVTEFRDGAFTEGGRPKPWNNQGRKAMFYFWKDTEAWLPTWTQPELLVDYVKVVAL